MAFKLIVQNSKIVLKSVANYIINASGIKDLLTGTSNVDTNGKIDWTLQHYADTAANFTSANPTLLVGQIGIETDNLLTTPKFKIGDGANDWNTLPYANSTSGGTWGTITGTLSNQTDLQTALNAKEDTANKSTNLNTDQASNTKYPSVKAVYDWATSVFTTASSVATQISNALSGYLLKTLTTSSSGISRTTTIDRFGSNNFKISKSFDDQGNNIIELFDIEINDRDIALKATSNNTGYVSKLKLEVDKITFESTDPSFKIKTDNLTASQTVETDANKNLVSAAKGTAYNKDFGTTAGTVLEGDKLPFVTPEMYGAVGDGTTDDATAIQNAVNSGSMVVLGAKNYRVNSSITLSGNKTIIGSGALSVIYTTSNISVFSITGSNNTIANLTILGNNTGTSQNGISAVGNVGFTLYYLNNIISECIFKNLGGSGIYSTNIIGSSSGNKHEGTYTINSCVFESCNYGANFAVRGEYNTMNNCAISSCTTGISITGGNNSVNGGKITDCTTGFELLNGTNDGHSVASGVMINHNTTNILSSSLSRGYMFNACMIYAGNVTITSSTMLNFSSCFFGGTFTLTSTSNTSTKFNNCNFDGTFTLSLTGTQPLFNGCKFSSQPSNVLSVNGDKVDISSSSTVLGWSSTTTKLIKYWASGKSLFVSFDIDGTSNSTSTSLTIPFGQSGATNTAKVSSIYAINSGSVVTAGGAAQITGISTTINFYTSMGLAAWTASGQKRIIGIIVIELEN